VSLAFGFYLTVSSAVEHLLDTQGVTGEDLLFMTRHKERHVHSYISDA